MSRSEFDNYICQAVVNEKWQGALTLLQMTLYLDIEITESELLGLKELFSKNVIKQEGRSMLGE